MGSHPWDNTGDKGTRLEGPPTEGHAWTQAGLSDQFLLIFFTRKELGPVWVEASPSGQG